MELVICVTVFRRQRTLICLRLLNVIPCRCLVLHLLLPRARTCNVTKAATIKAPTLLMPVVSKTRAFSDSLGACNMLWYGHGKVWELPDRDSLLNKVPDQFRGADPTPALYSKCMWSTWSGEPKILAKLGVTRVLQPPGYMMVTMPVSSSQLHAYLLP